MSNGPDTSRYDALDPKAQRYVDVAAKTLYLVDQGWDGQPGNRFWEQQVEGYNGEESAYVVAEYRLKALKVVEALAATTREHPVAPPLAAEPAAGTETVDLTKPAKDEPSEATSKTPETVDA